MIFIELCVVEMLALVFDNVVNGCKLYIYIYIYILVIRSLMCFVFLFCDSVELLNCMKSAVSLRDAASAVTLQSPVNDFYFFNVLLF
jgi:hypothetical protein